jgi:glycosyltransferase involved in cell wall biosynthesis
MANILFLSSNPGIIAPAHGGSERANALLNSLSEHSVQLLVFSWQGQDESRVISDSINYTKIVADPMVARKELRHRKNFHGGSHDLTMQLFYGEIVRYRSKVKKLLVNADLVFVDQFAVSTLINGIDINVPIIYDSPNFELDLAKQRYPQDSLDIKITYEMEKTIAERADYLITCSQEDLDGIKKEYNVKAKGFVVKNGAWKPGGVVPGENVLSNDIIFVGSGHPPNNAAVENILKVAELMPEYTFSLIGDSSYIANNTQLSNVKVLGKVDDGTLDVKFRDARAFLNPIEVGSGTHLKMTKAFAYNLPIVSSSVGARGFSDSVIEDAILIGNTTEEVVKQIKKLQDKSVYQQLCLGSEKSFKDYDWESILEDFRKTVREVVKENNIVSVNPKEKEKVLIYSIIRNEVRFVNSYYENLKKIFYELKDYEFYISIYENDSTDGTKEKLLSKDWSIFPNVSIISEKIKTKNYGSIKDADRVKNLSIARNKAIEAAGFLDKVDYVMMIESDFRFDTNAVRSLLEFKNLEPDFDIVSTISIRSNNLYDAWATRKGPEFVKGRQEIDADWRKTPYGKYYSTSNGICLYRAKPFQEGARYGWINAVTKEFDCDTVVVCQDFNERGYKNVYIMHNNPVYHEHK